MLFMMSPGPHLQRLYLSMSRRFLEACLQEKNSLSGSDAGGGPGDTWETLGSLVSEVGELDPNHPVAAWCSYW